MDRRLGRGAGWALTAIALLVQVVISAFYIVAALSVWGAFTQAPAYSKVLWALLVIPPFLSLALLLGKYRRGPLLIVLLTLSHAALVLIAMVI